MKGRPNRYGERAVSLSLRVEAAAEAGPELEAEG